MKKVLFTALGAAFLMSCAAKMSAAPAIAEAKTLQNLANDRGVQAPATAAGLIAEAEKKQNEGNVEAAFVLADEATLQLQIVLLKQENKNLAENLEKATETLNAANKALSERTK